MSPDLLKGGGFVLPGDLVGPGLGGRALRRSPLQGAWVMNSGEAGEHAFLREERLIRLLRHLRGCSQVGLGLHADGALLG